MTTAKDENVLTKITRDVKRSQMRKAPCGLMRQRQHDLAAAAEKSQPASESSETSVRALRKVPNHWHTRPVSHTAQANQRPRKNGSGESSRCKMILPVV